MLFIYLQDFTRRKCLSENHMAGKWLFFRSKFSPTKRSGRLFSNSARQIWEAQFFHLKIFTLGMPKWPRIFPLLREKWCENRVEAFWFVNFCISNNRKSATLHYTIRAIRYWCCANYSTRATNSSRFIAINITAYGVSNRYHWQIKK